MEGNCTHRVQRDRATEPSDYRVCTYRVMTLVVVVEHTMWIRDGCITWIMQLFSACRDLRAFAVNSGIVRAALRGHGSILEATRNATDRLRSTANQNGNMLYTPKAIEDRRSLDALATMYYVDSDLGRSGARVPESASDFKMAALAQVYANLRQHLHVLHFVAVIMDIAIPDATAYTRKVAAYQMKMFVNTMYAAPATVRIRELEWIMELVSHMQHSREIDTVLRSMLCKRTACQLASDVHVWAALGRGPCRGRIRNMFAEMKRGDVLCTLLPNCEAAFEAGSVPDN
jgi:hypothetical protein